MRQKSTNRILISVEKSGAPEPGGSDAGHIMYGSAVPRLRWGQLGTCRSHDRDSRRHPGEAGRPGDRHGGGGRQDDSGGPLRSHRSTRPPIPCLRRQSPRRNEIGGIRLSSRAPPFAKGSSTQRRRDAEATQRRQRQMRRPREAGAEIGSLNRRSLRLSLRLCVSALNSHPTPKRIPC